MKNLLLILFSILLLAACSTNHDTTNLALNNGSKWAVNAEMKPHLDQETVILKEYIAQGGTDYQALAEALKTQNGSLIKSCTMTGESHDELHKWLHPHMTLIDELAKEEDSAKAKEIVGKLEKSFGIYGEYFE